MWFKHLQIYRLPAPWEMIKLVLEDQLARAPFVKCPSNQPKSRGWAAPRNDGALVAEINRQWLIRLESEERLLPSSVINTETRDRAEALEKQQGYAPGRKQLKEMRERVTEELMPRAFPRRRSTYAWIDPVNGWFCVDASSPAKAEEVIEHLRHCLDEFLLTLLHTQVSPQAKMAEWLASGYASFEGFTVDRDCRLKSVGEEKAVVSYKHCALEGDEVKGHLAGGKLPTQLALTWDDRISFILTEKLEVKRLTFLDLLKNEAEQSAETQADQLDADFTLMTGELMRFLPALLLALGGEVKS
jgi:recombination associated protein RdgC